MKLQVKELCKSFGKNKVLQDIHFEIESGSITALVGRNGSGKTTLLEILANILRADKGDILLNNKAIKDNIQLQENIVYLPDNFDYFNFISIEKAMSYYEIVYDDFDLEYCKKEIESLGINCKQQLNSLSKGNKSLVGLIICLGTGAKIILLDEILDGLDILNRKKVYEYLIEAASQDKSILVSSHELEELQGLSNKVIYLSLEGDYQVISLEEKSNILKYQVVTKTSLPQYFKENTVESFSIGRIHTLLMEGSSQEWEKRFEEEGIAEYEAHALNIEDLFYWEQGRGIRNEEGREI